MNGHFVANRLFNWNKKGKENFFIFFSFSTSRKQEFFLCFYCMYINLELLIYNDDDAELVAIYNIARGLLFIWIINACKSIICASCVRIELYRLIWGFESWLLCFWQTKNSIFLYTWYSSLVLIKQLKKNLIIFLSFTINHLIKLEFCTYANMVV